MILPYKNNIFTANMDQRAIKSISLSELTTSIGGVLRSRFSDGMWVVAEVSECKVNSVGHCYLSLVERQSGSTAPIAEVRAAIWASSYRAIAAKFRSVTGSDIQHGMKLLFHCTVSFHSVYGLSLVIDAIDATYTIGESELQRQQTIERLTADGAITLQREQNPLPMVVQRIAVISSATAAGYEDFCKQIEDSEYAIDITLFEAMMQGEKTTSSIISALDSILSSHKQFDAVVIIRGGGAASDLRWFDNYELCYYISQYPIAILTGIGHEKDVSIADMVAYHSFKTPTAVAAGLVERIAVIDKRIEGFRATIEQLSQDILMGEWRRVEDIGHRLKIGASATISQSELALERLKGEIPNIFNGVIHRHSSHIQGIAARLTQEANFMLGSSQRAIVGVTQRLRVAVQSATEREDIRLRRVEASLQPLALSLIDREFSGNRSRLDRVEQYSSRALEGSSSKLEYLSMSFTRIASSLIERRDAELRLLWEQVKSNNPRRILELGYSLALDSHGRVVKDSGSLSEGDTLRIEFASGIATTEIKSIEQKNR